MSPQRINVARPKEVYDYIFCGGGTSGCVIAGRLTEDPNVKVMVVLEAGPDSEDLEYVHMAGGWTNSFDTELDWKIVTEPQDKINNRQVKDTTGRFLGGTSGINGSTAETFHSKDWHRADLSVHGTSGPLRTEPQDLAPISELVRESLMFSTGETAHGCGDAPRTVYQGIRTMAADFITKDRKRDNIMIKTEVTVDRVILSLDRDEITATGVKKQKFDEAAILPGVGKNLMDHVVCSRLYVNWARLDSRLASPFPPPPPPPPPPNLLGRDPMGLLPTQPNVEFWSMELYWGPKQFTDYPVDDKHAFAMGSVKLRPKDARENPMVDHKYLEHPIDMLVISEVCRFANEVVMEGDATKGVVKTSWPELRHYEYTEREEWDEYVKEHAMSCYHPSGTCAMGRSDDVNAVLDFRLRVRGVRNLRVAYVSSVPKDARDGEHLASRAMMSRL
ncbi:hypothetical protein PSV08DRAFT_387134 [Bipolaris maydis]|uniref:uncharacterized protein n=1 Tax=Cochliobolus heterostrophus TaxID=5016 RepID=UPI0024D1D9E6|nr:hypothetical protein PSV08DRAFT_387134 [Bipolaris maydis]